MFNMSTSGSYKRNAIKVRKGKERKEEEDCWKRCKKEKERERREFWVNSKII
jgi:hypothetical protein